jgi:hypothetical protein
MPVSRLLFPRNNSLNERTFAVRTTLLPVLGLVALAGAARAGETPVRSKIVAVSLFKNGLAVVRREVTLGKAGAYALDDLPNPVHGTFWVESTAPVDVVVQTREVEVPAGTTPPGTLQEDLGGKKVTIHLRGEKRAPIVGTILSLKPPKDGEESPREAPAGSPPPPPRYLVVQTAKGRCYLEPSEVSFVEAEDAGEKVKRKKSRMVLTVRDADREETRVLVSYLTHGLGWAPSYKIDITDPKTLSIEQQAVVKNELTDFDGAEVQLISGFPSVQFANVASPLSTRTSWAAFFQELNEGGPRPALYANNGIVYQQAILGNAASPNIGITTTAPAGEGVDLHYQSIGKRTLAEGDCLSTSVARGKAPYERIVEWLVPDTRDEWGRNIENRGRTDDDDSAWDALKFKNPLPFPMTTGPAMVTAGGKFNGLRASYWANTGEETVVRVNKALSVRTRSLENEDRKRPDEVRDLVWIGGRQFRKATVEGELAIGNHRAEEVHLVIRRRFSGELQEADGKPTTSLREDGVYSINRRSELLWNLTLKGGEDRKLTYRYTLLIAH